MFKFGNSPRGNVKGNRPVKDDTRTPLYLMFCGDLSGSMAEETRVIDEKGNAVYIPKIDQLNQGFRMTQKSLLRFMKENTRFLLKYQFIELNTYCKPLFQTFELINDPNYNLGEVTFTPGGSTNIEALFKTIISFLTHKHLGNYNRAVNIILLSDGVPTDVDGWALSEEAWKALVDEFKNYLDEHDLSRSVELYFIAVGNEAEAFGRYFAGEDHFFRVEDSESIADKLDFVTRQSLTNSTTVSSHQDDEDEDEEDEEALDGEDDTLDDEEEMRQKLRNQLANALDDDEDEEEGDEEFEDDEGEFEDEESDDEFEEDEPDSEPVSSDDDSSDEDDADPIAVTSDDDTMGITEDDTTDTADDDGDDGEGAGGADDDGEGEDDGDGDDDGDDDGDAIEDILNF